MLLLHTAATARSSLAASTAAAILAEAAALPLPPSLATCLHWEQAQLLWHQGVHGQPCARAMAFAAAQALVERAATVAGGNGSGSVAELHERTALAQACCHAAAWGMAEGRAEREHAVQLYARAIAVCGDSPKMAAERCHTHAMYAAWLEAEHRLSTVHRGRSPEELRASELYALAQRELLSAQVSAWPPSLPRFVCPAASGGAPLLRRTPLPASSPAI